MNKDLASVADPSHLGAATKVGISSYISGLKNEEASCGDRGDRPTRQSARGASASKGFANTQGSNWNKGATRAGSAAKGKTYNPDQNDKIYQLEQENTGLKLKENLLETEIVKMRTKLRRIEELMKKKRATQSGSQNMLPADVHRQLQEEINKMEEENLGMKDRNQKLRAIEKELIIRSVSKKAPVNKFSHVKGKLANTRLKQSDQDFNKLVEDLRVQVVQSERQIIQLTTLRDQLQTKQDHTKSKGNLQLELEAQQGEFTEINKRVAEIKSSLIRDEAMFSDSKQFISRKQSEIQELRRECENLAHSNFQISLRAQQAKELSDDLNALRAERDQLELSITTITASPFTKNQPDVPSTRAKAADFELRLDKLQRLAMKTKEEEALKFDAASDLKAKSQKLTGENDYIRGQHQEARQKFVAANGEVTDADVRRDLFKMDESKYAQAHADAYSRPESHPVWADYGFLDRGTKQDPQASSDLKYLKAEAARMKHENGDFAAELDKAESLLRLQTDIEKENRQYHQQEKERKKLLAQSHSLKAQEMAKRVDGQAKILREINQKLGLERGTSASSPAPGARAGGRQDPEINDTGSDFAVDAADEGAADENLLDLRIIDGMLDSAMIEACLQAYGAGVSAPKDAMTLVSVDFFDHDTQATQLAQGYRPQYQSQISFKNRMDSYYVQYLSKNKIKMEVHLAGTGKDALPLGTCEALLSDLVNASPHSHTGDQVVIEQHLNIVAAPGLSGATAAAGGKAHLGTLRIKMRLRKPISEAARYHKDMGEVKAATRAATTAAGKPGSLTAKKRQVVTVQILGCKDLTCRSGSAAQMAPFFHYQFFTFPERLSHTAAGPAPVFQDSAPYTMDFDDGAMKYLESQKLNIVLFDDNAPMTGIERGGQSSGAMGDEVDDLIGTCAIPLADLAKGIAINGDFDVRGLENESRGKMTVKISVVNPTSSTAAGRAQTSKDVKRTQSLSYTTAWEMDIVRRIATKLGRLSVDVELMFGIFSRGTPSCTREDFKYCCLQRLNLKDTLSEKEIDMLLDAKLDEKANMDRKQFVEIFATAIGEARHEAQNQEAMDGTLMARYNGVMRQGAATGAGGAGYGAGATQGGRTLQRSATVDGVTLMDFGRKEAVNVLVRCVLNSSPEQIQREVSNFAKHDKISADDLRKVLAQLAGISDFDAQKVIALIAVEGSVFASRFSAMLDEAVLDARFNSQAVQKFNQIIQSSGQVLSELFAAKDMNHDGQLNLDGFTSAMIGAGDLSDQQLSLPDYTEIFNLVSRTGVFWYAEYILEIDPKNKQHFSKLNLSERDSRRAESSMTMDHNKSMDLHPVGGKTTTTQSRAPQAATAAVGHGHVHGKSPALTSASAKVERFLIQQDVTLSTLFQVIDSNSDSQLARGEFKQKMRGLHMGLEEEELEAMFNDLDINRDGNVSYNEFICQFTKVNTAQLIKRIRKILYGARISAELIYNQHCAGRSMTRPEFQTLITTLIDDKLADFEIQSIFGELGRMGNGAIPKEQFLQWFSQDEQERVFQIGIEDIIKPLVTYLKEQARQKGTTPQQQSDELFEHYDQDRNQMLSASELKVALKERLAFDLSPEEVKTLHEFFRAKYRRSEIRKGELAQLLDQSNPLTKLVRRYDSNLARTSLSKVKLELRKTRRDAAQLLGPAAQQQKGFEGRINLRAFKLTIFTLGVLTQQQVNNLAKYMDRANSGMISIADMSLALETDEYTPATLKEHKGKR